MPADFKPMTESDKAALIKKLDNIIVFCDVVKILIESYDQRVHDYELNKQRTNLGIEASTFNDALYPFIRPEPYTTK